MSTTPFTESTPLYGSFTSQSHPVANPGVAAPPQRTAQPLPTDTAALLEAVIQVQRQQYEEQRQQRKRDKKCIKKLEKKLDKFSENNKKSKIKHKKGKEHGKRKHNDSGANMYDVASSVGAEVVRGYFDLAKVKKSE
jgi:hypothetical protein